MKFSDKLYILKCLFFPQNRWAARSIPRTWEDFPELIERIGFNGLIFSWEEDNVGTSLEDNSTYNWENELGEVEGKKENRKRKQIYKALKNAYEWAKTRDEKAKTIYNDLPGEARLRELELYEKEDEKHFMNIMKYRKHIWS